MADKEWIQTSTGVKMPWIIYGTAWKKERTADLVVAAIQGGFKGIDTACQPKHYDEHQVGAALDRLKDNGIARETLFLQTKFTPLPGQDPRRIPYDRNSPVESQVTQSFTTSLKNLRTGYVDSLVLHSPIAPYSDLMKVWEAMGTIQETGGTRQLGISNCHNPELLRRLYADAKVKPAIVQNRFYQGTRYDIELRQWCFTHGVIYQSFWVLTANPHILFSNSVQTIARKFKKTEAQVFFRYLNQSGIVPLTGTCSEQHMREDLNVFDFELSSDDLVTVSQLLVQP
ncbi:MAG: aldo/keto reductase [Thermodesulfobacteriota bacterium]|nr:aldo/keto reductase [Thermodesulfobacteriota bacterium]